MASKGAPFKAPLHYFQKTVNFYEDDKIIDLLDEYGPLGVTIYDCILTIVYSNGYYAELSQDKLSRMVIRKIGNKWIKNRTVVVQVIHYCAELGLLCHDLMLQNVITSVGIQRRYYEVAVRQKKRQLYNLKYWLLDDLPKKEKEEPLLNSPLNPISSEENGINSELNDCSSEEKQQKRKENKEKGNIIINNNKENSEVKEMPAELQEAILDFIKYRKEIGKPLTYTTYQYLLKELQELSENPSVQIRILQRSMLGGYSGIFPLNEYLNKKKDPKFTGPNSFHNFEQRDTDYDALVAEEMRKRIASKHGESDEASINREE